MNRLRYPIAAMAVAVVLAPAAPAHAEFIQAALNGYEEVPAISTPSIGQFRAMISRDNVIDYELTYYGLRGDVTQAHVHFGQAGVNGGVMLWLCGTPGRPGPAESPPPLCPAEGTVSGVLMADDVQAIGVQGIDAGDLAQAIAAIRAGAAYVNVHSERFPSGEIRGQIRASRQERPSRP